MGGLGGGLIFGHLTAHGGRRGAFRFAMRGLARIVLDKAPPIRSILIIRMIRLGHVTRNGTSLAVNLPRPVLNALRLAVGDLVVIAVEGDVVRIRRVDENMLVSHVADGVRAGAGSSKGG